MRIADLLKTGQMYCEDSLSYCNIESDLMAKVNHEEAITIANKYGFDEVPDYGDKQLNKLLGELDKEWKQLAITLQNPTQNGIKIEVDKKAIRLGQSAIMRRMTLITHHYKA